MRPFASAHRSFARRGAFAGFRPFTRESSPGNTAETSGNQVPSGDAGSRDQTPTVRAGSIGTKMATSRRTRYDVVHHQGVLEVVDLLNQTWRLRPSRFCAIFLGPVVVVVGHERILFLEVTHLVTRPRRENAG